MGHTKPAMLSDLGAELSFVRELVNLKEKSTGVFYYKSFPFLHFHDKDGVRWADVKCKDGSWLRLDIDFKAKASVKVNFIKAVKKAHLLFLK